MPHLRFRNIQTEHIKSLSKSLKKPLADIMKTTEDNFTFEKINSEFFEDGSSVTSYPFVEVLWFARTKEIQDASAMMITNEIKKLVPHQDVVLVFTVAENTNYYENGKHF